MYIRNKARILSRGIGASSSDMTARRSRSLMIAAGSSIERGFGSSGLSIMLRHRSLSESEVIYVAYTAFGPFLVQVETICIDQIIAKVPR